MRLNRMASIFIILMLMIMMTGCAVEKAYITSNGYSISSYDFTKEDLVYDANTKIVYITNHTYNGNVVYTPYFADNGYPYKYIDGELIKID